MTKMCYIIGPIRSKWGLIGRLINIWRGRQAAVKLWKAGFAVICPHLNSFTLAMALKDEDEIVRLDCELVRRCDFVVIVGDISKSKGAAVELASITRLGITCGTGENYPYTKELYYSVEVAINDEKD